MIKAEFGGKENGQVNVPRQSVLDSPSGVSMEKAVFEEVYR